MRGRNVRVEVFDAGHLIGLMAEPTRDEPHVYAFAISVETAEGLIGKLQAALETAATRRADMEYRAIEYRAA